MNLRTRVEQTRIGRLPALRRQLLAVDYLWYNSAKKINLRTVDGFSQIASRIMAEPGRTFLREDRLYTLWQAAEQAKPGHVVEVGVYRGGSSAFLAEALAAHGKSNRIFSVDTFAGHAVVDVAVDADHRVAEGFRETSADEVRAYLKPYPSVTVIEGAIGDVSDQIDDSEPVAIAHIDVDVYPATAYCLRHFGDRLVSGGMMIVDDYGFLTCPGALRAVEEFLDGRDDFVRLHLLTGQAVLVKC